VWYSSLRGRDRLDSLTDNTRQHRDNTRPLKIEEREREREKRKEREERERERPDNTRQHKTHHNTT
jgi:hypothetical protein